MSTELDLNPILAAGWATPADFTPAEYARAEAFYASMRVHDARLLELRERAAGLIREWTGREPRDVGSLGTRLNLETSDLDLGIGFPVADRENLKQVLADRTTFLGERRTSFSTTRLVFSFTLEGVEVDLSALTDEDFLVACRMLDQIAEAMTEEERICHLWVKHLLREQGRLTDYAKWKLVTYARFCPEFNWVPIPEKAGI
ncbi:hypothetical protein OG689_42290 [Kitasatospora sp. NBC_00240]|uniref:hypothetical protein n=1 Tax=Kitasatospora sp. NBC_00240 TaxID=2903567 RepID=UPI002259FD9A|nr:hypothetical protein [Kitasatospora sp. NBC_00240]MCX5215786.1 hypothetical protein [Kitasatospora sp. NBC_00240]